MFIMGMRTEDHEEETSVSEVSSECARRPPGPCRNNSERVTGLVATDRERPRVSAVDADDVILSTAMRRRPCSLKWKFKRLSSHWIKLNVIATTHSELSGGAVAHVPVIHTST